MKRRRKDGCSYICPGSADAGDEHDGSIPSAHLDLSGYTAEEIPRELRLAGYGGQGHNPHPYHEDEY